MQINEGYRFGVYGADSTGEVIKATPGAVSYRYDHAPEVTYGMPFKDFAKISFPIAQATATTA